LKVIDRVIFIEQKSLDIPFWLKMNMTIKEAAAYSGIGETTIRNLLAEKACPFLLKIGSKNLIKRQEFEKYMQDKHYI